MNEAETRAEHIDPALRAAGWGVAADSRVRREYHLTRGRIVGHGQPQRPEIADYVLFHRNRPLAVVEAKAWDRYHTEGLGQAKAYAAKLGVRFAYSTNGQRLYRADLLTGEEGDVDAYPGPEALWAQTFAVANPWRDRFGAVPFPDKGGSWDLRYYQQTAVDRVLERVAAGDAPRILLTLATGTGKTSIAFQIAWKLFASRWNLGREGTRRPRILFLADRNTLANQAFNDFTSFGAFAEDALARIRPGEVRRTGEVPKNAAVFFTIFQTFLSGPGDTPYFGQYPPDFFDFIVIDECHRGGANDESTWRDILEYFRPAVQLGLTATPKRRDNVDTYRYFGEPVFTYSLRDGINDGFLTPFKVRQISTTLDDYVYTPDDRVMEGEVEAGRRYGERDFNRTIVIDERERRRVEIFMGQIDQREKTLVFCASQGHALAVRDLVNQLRTSRDPNYCARVTADDGERGEESLRAFQDNEKTVPTVLTTSQKLSTGVDARNVRNIVLMRPIGSMIEFKQIIGRGTRLYEGKEFFTIYDFVKAHQHFNDPEWDGEPLEPEPPGLPPVPPPPPREPVELPPRQRVRVRLADGKARTIQHMMATSYWHPDGTPMSAQQFMEMLFGKLPEFFANEDELRALWSDPTTRRRLLDGLGERGFGREQLTEMQRIIDAEHSDLFDVLAHVAYALPPLTREERADRARPAIATRFSDQQRAFLGFVLAHYVSVGVEELDRQKLTSLLRLRYHYSLADAVADLGGAEKIGQAFVGFQRHLYEPAAG